GNQWNAPDRPILCGRFGVTAHNDFASIEVHVAPCDLIGFAFSATSECQSAEEVRAISRTPCARLFYRIAKSHELVTARQRELLRADWHAFQLFGRVAIHNPCVF